VGREDGLMIKRPTILVLGAGASVPYGYPTGPELLRIIFEDLTDPGKGEIKGYLKTLGFENKTIDDFAFDLAFSESPSVDAFLESRSEYIEIGKLAMAMYLVRCEDIQRLLSARRMANDPGWYHYLFNKMVGPKLEDFGNNDLSIITFNYDRSLEFQWFSALKHRFGSNNETKIKAMLRQIRIVHVHGRLGEVPWGDSPCREYERNFKLNEIKALSDQIIVMSELQETSKDYEIANYYLRAGTFIYFLGFGYHTKNLERLGIKKYPDRKLYGSSMGMEKGEAEQINSSWGIQFLEPGLSILDLFKKYQPIDQEVKY
jgi:hypothetical protein